MRKLLPLLTVALWSSNALATEPWVDPDPPGPPERHEIGEDFGVSAELEYRVNYLFVNPISLGTETNRRANWIEHRGRVGGSLDYDKKVKLTVSLDLLDGVMWGDNGTFTDPPKSNSGMQITTRDPNIVKPCIQYVGTGGELEADGYGYALCEADPIKLRRLYGQVNTPIGALRIGRQPVTIGMAVQAASGDGRRNRFGIAHEGDSVDRVLFATKPLEAFKPKELRNTSEHEGFIFATMYDRWASDSIQRFVDDVNQIAVAARYLQPDFLLGTDFQSTLFYAHRWNKQYSTRVNTVGGRVAARFGDLHMGVDLAGNIGTTREISEAYSLISNDPVNQQTILQFGARGVVKYDRPMWGVYLEADYASGDGDPSPGTNLSQFRFAEDTNVGLLLFEHVLRFQSARSSAAAVEILRRLGATTFPAETIHTRGSFTNAFALFPQFDIKPVDTVFFRGGVLVAWAPERVNDPVASLQGEDNGTIEDDLVNFAGGGPGQFYGVELDARFNWRFMDHFTLDLEGAVLFPGDALQNENGVAVHSFLTQARTSFFF